MDEILSNLSPVLLLGLQVREAGQMYHLGPVCGARSAAETRDHHQLLEVFISLKNKVGDGERNWESDCLSYYRCQCDQCIADLKKRLFGEELA